MRAELSARAQVREAVWRPCAFSVGGDVTGLFGLPRVAVLVLYRRGRGTRAAGRPGDLGSMIGERMVGYSLVLHATRGTDEFWNQRSLVVFFVDLSEVT